MADGVLAGDRAAISLTHVEYTKGDFVGFFLAWTSLAPIFLLVSFVTLILFRRDLNTMFFFLGILTNEACNFVLKHVIKEPRPDRNLFSTNLFVEYGMPSSHAQYMAFFATYFTLFLFVRARLSEGVADYIFKSVCSLAAITGAFLCSFSRIYLGYHTPPQVLYGTAIGSVLACVWFLCMHFIFSQYFPKIYYSALSELFLIKDMTLIPNSLWFEFTAARIETRKRLKMKTN